MTDFKEILVRMIRHALHKGWHYPYTAIAKPVVTDEPYYIVKPKNRSRHKYRCAHCANIFRRSEVQRDHIEPLISIYDAENGFEDIFERGFCEEDGLQLLCRSCHHIKTQLENALRRQK